jgi:hypothetical protein
MSDVSTDQASGQDQSNASGEDAANKGFVPLEHHRELLGQRKKDQEKIKALEVKFKEIEEKEKLAHESKLMEAGNYKALLEDREKEKNLLAEKLKDYETQVKTYEETFTNTKKLNAFNKALGGKLKNEDYYRFVDTNKIAIDPESGKVDDGTLKNYTKEFATKYKDLIDYGFATLPDGAPARTSIDLNSLKGEQKIKEAIKAALQQ